MQNRTKGCSANCHGSRPWACVICSASLARPCAATRCATSAGVLVSLPPASAMRASTVSRSALASPRLKVPVCTAAAPCGSANHSRRLARLGPAAGAAGPPPHPCLCCCPKGVSSIFSGVRESAETSITRACFSCSRMGHAWRWVSASRPRSSRLPGGGPSRGDGAGSSLGTSPGREMQSPARICVRPSRPSARCPPGGRSSRRWSAP
mmetsp:Transcript_29606/g.83470  ORF Transcript_29606/g.83470 Transcript_29606/m.83470 type:complete len:208 (-) Transcript_29606:1621-2244(-)